MQLSSGDRTRDSTGESNRVERAKARAMEAARPLHQDNRGAIMFVGLGMSCFLIGALWFLIGIGDALVFRDTMQEATDHVAFTSAVLHAKGMNFISACNLLLVGVVAIHLFLGFVQDISIIICAITLGFGCGGVANARKLYTGYFKIMQRAGNILHVLEEGAAWGYPYLGFLQGWRTGHDYGSFGTTKRNLNVLAVSPSMFPGKLVTGPISGLFKTLGADSLSSPAKKLALPVQERTFGDVCKRITNKAFTELVGAPDSKAATRFKRLVTDIVANRYCNDLTTGSGGSSADELQANLDEGNKKIDSDNAKADEINAANKKKRDAGEVADPDVDKAEKIDAAGAIDPGFSSWWGQNGPIVPWGATSNGSSWQQVWALNLLPSYDDASEGRVGFAQRQFGIPSSAHPTLYSAQAEFFFDCADAWGTENCNMDDNAGYSIKWRARLRRTQLPELGSMGTSLLGDYIINMQGLEDVKLKLKNSEGLKRLADATGLGSVGTSAMQSGINQVFMEMNAALRAKANEVGATLNPKYPGIYH